MLCTCGGEVDEVRDHGGGLGREGREEESCRGSTTDEQGK